MIWLHLFFSLHGRITRLQFWAGVATIVVLQLIVQIPVMNSAGIEPDKGPPPLWFRNLSLFLDVLSAWPLFAIMAKRQEDRDQGPRLSWYLVTLLLTFSSLEAFGLTQEGTAFTPLGYLVGLPLLGVIGIVIFELGTLRGTEGPNRFGPDPLQD